MTLTTQQVLISNGYLKVEGAEDPRPLTDLLKNRNLLTVISNINYYGYMPSEATLKSLVTLDADALSSFWKEAEAALKELTADNRNMDDFVVYQNFPSEVLEMSQSEYWCKQILMYFGYDKDWFREDKVARDPLFEKTSLKVLHLADERTLHSIYHSLMENKSRWTVPQLAQAQFLLTDLGITDFTMSKVSFRENGIQAVNYLMNTVDDATVVIEDATDVLRLAALRSEADVALRQKVKFKSFSRKERRFLCQMLENSNHLEGDLAERPALWKLLLRRLHPGDFQYQRLSKAYDALYRGNLRSFASSLEQSIKDGNVAVLELLQKRPGEFARRFHQLHNVFGHKAAEAFSTVFNKLTTQQLLKIVRYAETIDDRKTLSFPPRGNWGKLQIVENKKKPLGQESVDLLRGRASAIIKGRLDSILPGGFDVDPMMEYVKLQTNDQEFSPYGRGTVFPIPEEMTYIRSGSYWEFGDRRTVWYDNGWNFFDAEWTPKDTLCWNRTNMGGAAVFSGDPMSGADKKQSGTCSASVTLHSARPTRLLPLCSGVRGRRLVKSTSRAALSLLPPLQAIT